MSLDVSPDGRTIVFDLLGDLYTLSIAGGIARRLTSGPAINRQPRFSPDGLRLVFVSDRGGSENVWIADRDGRNARQLSALYGHDGSGAVTSPEWSPDGRTIVVSQKPGATQPPDSRGQSLIGSWLLAEYDVESGKMRWISDTTPNRARGALGAAFGRRSDVVFASMSTGALTGRGAFGEYPTWHLARIDLTTGRIQPEMGENVGRLGMRPALSPDGRYLAYASSSGSYLGLRLRDLRDDRERWLVREALSNPPKNGAERNDLVPGYAFTPDAKAVIAAYGGTIHRLDITTGRASVIPFVAEVERGLGPLTVHEFALADSAVPTRSVLQPALSPDGDWVAFSALDRIWVMQLPRGGRLPGRPHRLTADSIGEFYPAWSPDGRWIAYSTWRDGEGGAVRRVAFRRSPGEDLAVSTRLTQDSAFYLHVAVAPDGNRVVAARLRQPSDQILTDPEMFQPTQPLDPALVWLPATGGQARIITSLKGPSFRQLRHPIDQVYFTADTGRIFVGLSSWRWDGTDQRTSLSVVARDSAGTIADDVYGVSGVLSPDRRRAMVSRLFALYEVALPTESGNEPDTMDLAKARTAPFHAVDGGAHRWGRALAPWISWSRDGHRVLFNQGGTLQVGDIRADGWTALASVNVPLVVPVDRPLGTLVLRGARLVTMRGNEVIERGDLVVQNNRIAAVGRTGTVAVPPGAHIVDVGGTTIIPGYVDIHDHSVLPAGVHPGQSWQCLVRIAYGVTASRDPNANYTNDIFTYHERERDGSILCPRLFSTGIAYYGTDLPIRTIDDARDAVRPHADYFATETFKVYYDHMTDRRARQLLAMAATEKGLNATAHTNDVQQALVTAFDGLSGIEHDPTVPIYDDVATLIARSGTTITFTYMASMAGVLSYVVRRDGPPWAHATIWRLVPRSAWSATCVGCTGELHPYFGPVELDQLLPIVRGAARVVAKGGRVGMGSHGNLPGLGFHYEMWLHALGGMHNHDILRSATIVGATAIGHTRDFGSLEPGKLADLQVLNHNPLTDIHYTTSIRYVMKNGRLYRAEDLTEIWPAHRSLASTYLWSDRSSAAAVN